MPRVFITDRDGCERGIDIQMGNTLMQTITDAGMSELLALCGGMCSCATCHVYIDDEFDDVLPPMTPDESGLLETLEYRRECSRLSCQITLSHLHDGLKATIAPSE